MAVYGLDCQRRDIVSAFVRFRGLCEDSLVEGRTIIFQNLSRTKWYERMTSFEDEAMKG